MEHRLDPLLRPQSVAVVGASPKEDSMGWWVLENLERGGFTGDVYLVNPGYEKVGESACYPGISELPEPPELAIFAVGDHRLEAAFDQAIDAGIKAAVIMSTLVLDGDADPPLKQRIQRKAAEAGLLVCGANGMGFYNVRDNVWACGFDSTHHPGPGNVAIISHSGAGMSGIIDCEARLQINLAVSTGNEISVSMDEYLDFALDVPETRVVGLFIETARDPLGFEDALAKAASKGIPIIALKVGRTQKSAELAVSHSGALAGDDATYDALFNKYGVQRVYDQDAWTTALIMFAHLHPVGGGGLVSLHDSGGERQLLVDMADDAGVPLTTLSDETVAALAAILDPELPPVNPLDGWSRGGPNASEVMTQSLSLMMQDKAAALGAVVLDRAPDGKVYSSYLGYMQRAKSKSGKPVALVSARQGIGHDEAVVTSTHAGYPVLDGVASFLTGVRALFEYRDFACADQQTLQQVDSDKATEWHVRLSEGITLGEFESLQLLSEFGIDTVRELPASSIDETVAAAREIGFPVVLKSAQPGLLHKTEAGGVVLDIGDEASLRAAFEAMSATRGDDVLVATMAEPGVEMFLGVKIDRQFGPVVLLGFGGIHAEVLKDVQFLMPPFDAAAARRALDRCYLRPLLDGTRGRPAVDMDALCETAARFSSVVKRLDYAIAEFDINPLIAGPTGCVAVDALVVGRPLP